VWTLFKKLHLESTNSTSIQFYRYLFVGGFAFIVDFGLLYLFTNYYGINYIVSASLSFVIGSVFNYALSTKWIFSVRTVANKKTEFVFFIVIGLSGLLLNALIIWFFTHIFGVYYLVSKIISAAVIFSWNFAARKFLLFS
jgi:putative flippase GtrA